MIENIYYFKSLLTIMIMTIRWILQIWQLLHDEEGAVKLFQNFKKYI